MITIGLIVAVVVVVLLLTAGNYQTVVFCTVILISLELVVVSVARIMPHRPATTEGTTGRPC